jgi:hypothetical protein
VFEQAVNATKRNPGVGRYDMDKKKRIEGTYTCKGPKSFMFDDAAYKSMQTPFAYPEVKIDKYKMSSPKIWKIQKPLKPT